MEINYEHISIKFQAVKKDKFMEEKEWIRIGRKWIEYTIVEHV